MSFYFKLSFEEATYVTNFLGLFFLLGIHTQFSRFECSCRWGFLFLLCLSHTNTMAHRWKIIRKINLFFDGFYFVCCFSFFPFLQNQYLTLLCHIFHYFLCLMLWQHGFPTTISCTTRLRSLRYPDDFGMSVKDERNFPDDIDLRVKHGSETKPRRISLLKFFRSLNSFWWGGGLCEYCEQNFDFVAVIQ